MRIAPRRDAALDLIARREARGGQRVADLFEIRQVHLAGVRLAE